MQNTQPEAQTDQPVQNEGSSGQLEPLQTHAAGPSGPLKPTPAPQPLPVALTPKNRLFLQLLLDHNGDTITAYNKAGYKGNAHAAYTLRARLRHELREMAEARGMDEAGLMTDIIKINNLPLSSQEITPKEYINLLKLRYKMIADSKESKQTKPSPVFIKADQVQIGKPDDNAL